MSIGRRLALGSGLLLAMLALAALAGTLQFNSIGRINQRITELDWRKAETASLINATTRRNAGLTTALLITDNKARMAQVNQMIDTNKRRIDEAMATLEQLVYLPGWRELLAEIKDKRARLVASFTKVRQLVANEALQAPIGAMSDLQRKVVKDGNADVQPQIWSDQWLMVGLAILGLALGATAARLISRSITRALDQAVSLAQHVAAGDLSAKLEARSPTSSA